MHHMVNGSFPSAQQYFEMSLNTSIQVLRRTSTNEFKTIHFPWYDVKTDPSLWKVNECVSGHSAAGARTGAHWELRAHNMALAEREQSWGSPVVTSLWHRGSSSPHQWPPAPSLSCQHRKLVLSLREEQEPIEAVTLNTVCDVISGCCHMAGRAPVSNSTLG